MPPGLIVLIALLWALSALRKRGRDRKATAQKAKQPRRTQQKTVYKPPREKTAEQLQREAEREKRMEQKRRIAAYNYDYHAAEIDGLLEEAEQIEAELAEETAESEIQKLRRRLSAIDRQVHQHELRRMIDYDTMTE